MTKMIGAYRPLTPFQTVGSGSARWCGAKRGKSDIFSKFLSPVYPAQGGNAALYQRQIGKMPTICGKEASPLQRMSCVIGDTLVLGVELFSL